MKIIDLQNNTELSTAPACAAAVGNFDGVHSGHMALLERTKSIAEEKGLSSAVWTFSSYCPKTRGVCITTTAYRNRLFADAGIKYLFLYDYEQVCGLSPEEFVRDILISDCNIRSAVCGYNFRFGHNAEGHADDLVKLMSVGGGQAEIVGAVTLDGQTVSSTAICGYLSQGEPEKAAAMLGRPFSIKLPVVHGRHLGSTLGYPTINQNFPPEVIVPRHGVYACRVTIDGRKYKGASNVGLRPTVDGVQVNCETHIIGCDMDLYSREIQVDFLSFLRPERKFESLEALKAQIRQDVEQAGTIDELS